MTKSKSSFSLASVTLHLRVSTSGALWHHLRASSVVRVAVGFSWGVPVLLLSVTKWKWKQCHVTMHSCHSYHPLWVVIHAHNYYTHTYTMKCAHAHTHTHIHMHAHTHMHTHPHPHTYTHAHTHTHMCTQVHARVRTHTIRPSHQILHPLCNIIRLAWNERHYINYSSQQHVAHWIKVAVQHIATIVYSAV